MMRYYVTIPGMRDLACVSILSLFSAAANAVPVVWTLDRVVFSDGSTASESFTFDVDTNT